MIDLIINEYIKKMSPTDIKIFAKYNQIELSDNESQYLLIIVKKNWRTILYGNPKDLFEKIRRDNTSDLYQKSQVLFKAIQDKFRR